MYQKFMVFYGNFKITSNAHQQSFIKIPVNIIHLHLINVLQIIIVIIYKFQK